MEPFPLFPSRLLEQDFGTCITPQDLILPTNNICTPNYFRPWKWYIPNIKDCGSTIENDKNKFQVTLDVQHFRPSEISVKVLNNQILIEGNHEERHDEHGMVSRQFTRRYALPRDCNADDVTCNLSSDGVLTVIANKKCNEKLHTEISVPIKLCDSFSKKREVQSSLKSDQLVEKTSTDAKEDRCDILKKDSEETCKHKSQHMLKEDKLLKPEHFMQSTSSAENKTLETKADMQELLKTKTEKFDEVIDEIATKTDDIIKFAKDSIDQCTTDESVIEHTMKGTIASSKDDSIKTTVRSEKEDSMTCFKESLDETIKCSVATTMDESTKSTFGYEKEEAMKASKKSALDETVKSSIASTIGESIKSTVAFVIDDSNKSTTSPASETSIKPFMESTLDETMKCSIASTVDESTKSSVASALEESTKLITEIAGMSSMSAASEMSSYSNETMQAEEFSTSFMTTMTSNIKPSEKSSELLTDTITAALKEAAENM